jgi:serine/threonine protein kinase
MSREQGGGSETVEMDGQSGTPQQGGALPLADRYRVLARVGLGGTAVVYRCVDLHTERIVAVKVLRTNGPLIPEAAARFRREAHLAAALAHAHIVRVLDFGYTVPLATASRVPWMDDPDQPVPYLAMEYVFGCTLKELVRRRGPLPFDWIWTVGQQLCQALATAHAKGVVHRDVKPQNVLVLDSRIELLAKLTDFGIARQVGADLTNLTVTGQVIGTPDYLSPEQVLGEPGGPAADLYSLGIVLYELTTSRLPFEADTPLAAASRRMVVDPPPPSAYRRDVPRALQEVILLALRREPAERYSDALEFAQALRWSREQTPDIGPRARGEWVLEPRVTRGPRTTTAAPAAARPSVESGPARTPLARESRQESQPSVMRVVADLPALEAGAEDAASDAEPFASSDTGVAFDQSLMPNVPSPTDGEPASLGE